MIRDSVGSSKRFHHCERSRDGDATGKFAAFFQSPGTDRFSLTPGTGSAQLDNPANRRLINGKVLGNFMIKWQEPRPIFTLKHWVKNGCVAKRLHRYASIVMNLLEFRKAV